MFAQIKSKRFRIVSSLVFLAAGTVACSGTAWAATLSYQLSGAASGNLNGIVFTGADFTFTGVGDSAGVSELFPGVFINALQTASTTLSGIGTLQPVNAFYFFVNQEAPAGAGFIDGIRGDVLDVEAPGFASYDGASPLAPLPVEAVYFASFSTTGGALSFESASDLVFTATEVTAAVPEPSSLSMVCAAALLLVLYARRRRVRT